MVLLHGGGATSTVWFANVETLSRTHRLYAVDQIGDAGRSVHNGQPIKSRDDFMEWLDGVLDALALGSVDLCGHSYGAWLALNFALHAPKRVGKLVLLDPSECFTGMKLKFRLHALPLFARPSEQRSRDFLAWETGGRELVSAWLTLWALGRGTAYTSKVLPHRPTTSELQAATVPTLVLVAEDCRLHDIGQLTANAKSLMPNVVTATLPDTSHFTIPTRHPQRLNQKMAQFLA